MPPHWHVVRTRPLGEYLAADSLRRIDLQVFFPRIRTRQPRLGRQDVPLFPGYLFFRYNLDEDGWPAFYDVPHVLGPVQFEGVSPPVPDEVIDTLAKQVDMYNEERGPRARLIAGQRVRVVSGKLECLAEVVVEPKSKQARVRVLLEFLGRMVIAQVPRGDVWLMDPWESRTSPQHRSPRRTRGRGRWIGGWRPHSMANPSNSPALP